jgi:RNA polymerase sigma-70 factor (ECF subfamily)
MAPGARWRWRICAALLHPSAARSVSIDVEPINRTGGEHERDDHDRDSAGRSTGECAASRRVLRHEQARGMLRAGGEGELLPAGGGRGGRMRMSVATARPMSVHPERPVTETVWAELHERLRAFVARRVPDRVVVDDLAQEILLRLYTHMGRLREQERLDAWAYQVARNVIADYWRERAARRELLFDRELSDRLASLPELESDDEADQRRSEIASCLAPMVERLAEPYQQAIRLTDLGARTQAEAAAELGLSVPGMKARVQRGRAQLRELLRACCRIELDRRGQVSELERNDPSSGAAGACAGSSN